MITYKKVRDKYIFCKDGVYYALTIQQISEMQVLMDSIIKEEIELILCTKKN